MKLSVIENTALPFTCFIFTPETVFNREGHPRVLQVSDGYLPSS